MLALVYYSTGSLAKADWLALSVLSLFASRSELCPKLNMKGDDARQ
jgi:hypothetical protein